MPTELEQLLKKKEVELSRHIKVGNRKAQSCRLCREVGLTNIDHNAWNRADWLKKQSPSIKASLRSKREAWLVGMWKSVNGFPRALAEHFHSIFHAISIDTTKSVWCNFFYPL